MNKVFVINQHSKLEEITSDIVKVLLEQDKGEDIYFDFKPGIKIQTEDYKYQVRKCLSSFANTFGGFVFFGIQDNKLKHKLNRLEAVDKTPEFGKEINDKFLSSGLCVPGVDFEGPIFIEVNNKNIAVIKILETEKKPHAIKKNVNAPFEFWSRGSGTAKPLDYFEIIKLLEESREMRKMLVSLFLDLEEIISISNIKISSRSNDNTLPQRFSSFLVKEWGYLTGILSSDVELLRKLFPIKSDLVGADDHRDYLFSQSVLPLSNKAELVKNGNQVSADRAENIKKRAEEIRNYLFENYSVIREFAALTTKNEKS